MPPLFVLLPDGHEPDHVLAHAPSQLAAQLRRLRCQRYPHADDRAHLESLILSIGDRAAVCETRSTARSVLPPALIGSLGAALLAITGVGVELDLEVAIGGGFFLGAVSGLYRHASAPVTLAAPLADLLADYTPGCTVVSWTGADDDALHRLQELCTARRLRTR